MLIWQAFDLIITRRSLLRRVRALAYPLLNRWALRAPPLWSVVWILPLWSKAAINHITLMRATYGHQRNRHWEALQ